MKIISLVPSLSETLAELGFRASMIGITQFCVYPSGLHRSCQIIGGTKTPDMEKMKRLQPTHIFVNGEENTEPHIRECQNIAPTLTTFPKSPQDVPQMLRDMGNHLCEPSPFEDLAQELEQLIGTLALSMETNINRYLYFIWRNPYMVAGQDTYISNLLSAVNWKNECPHKDRYPVIDLKKMNWKKIDRVLLSSEPFPFRKRHAKELRNFIGPSAPDIYWVDGRIISWYGWTTVKALRLLLAIQDKRNMTHLIRPIG